jgi:Uma2 family endonuclease
MTTRDLLALPEDDGVERYLIRGQLREVRPGRREPTTKRDCRSSRVVARLAQLLRNWRDGQPEPRGDVFAGEAGCILRHNPDTTVGIDVVYVSAEVVARESDETTLIDGVPTLVVEILSPNTTVEEIEEKVEEYLAAKVPLIWIVNPRRRTVEVVRPDAPPQLFNETQELSAEPHLPGFRVPVTRIFGR